MHNASENDAHHHDCCDDCDGEQTDPRTTVSSRLTPTGGALAALSPSTTAATPPAATSTTASATPIAHAPSTSSRDTTLGTATSTTATSATTTRSTTKQYLDRDASVGHADLT